MFGSKQKAEAMESIEEMKDVIIDKLDTIDDLKDVMVKKFDSYDREFKKMSRTAKVCVGVGLCLSATNTIILIKILKKMR